MAVGTDAWDETFDVVVVGYGFAGGAAAISAHDAGARVLLIEKNVDPGGTSICSAGGIRIAKDAGEALTYLEATNADTTPRETLKALADGMATITPWVEGLAKAAGAETIVSWMPANYPFEGYRTFGFLSIAEIPGHDILTAYPNARGLRGGTRFFTVVDRNVRKRDIEVRFACAATRLIKGAENRVDGVVVQTKDGSTRRIRARGGVILATGGFEGCDTMKAQYWQGKPVLPQAYRLNTGDGIRMAQQAGADLWHMWHYHGSYGMRHEGYPYAIRLVKLPDWIPGDTEPDFEIPAFFRAKTDYAMPWIVVDKLGRRYMNEYPPYVQDTGHRDMEPYDATTQQYLRIPSWLVIDQEGLDRGQLGLATYNDPEVSYVWSADNSKEIENGLLKRADTLAELAGIIGCEAAELEETAARWNSFCERGDDPDFSRMPKSLVAIKSPPYYTTELWPMVGNTQGGPVHDAAFRILDPFGEVIQGLYEAGELGSVFGHLYLSGGNLAECFVGGRIAATHAAARAKASA
ncbi:MAG: FAD-dependent oxidoreductase [Hyphomicrobiaceae bacterium]